MRTFSALEVTLIVSMIFATFISIAVFATLMITSIIEPSMVVPGWFLVVFLYCLNILVNFTHLERGKHEYLALLSAMVSTITIILILFSAFAIPSPAEDHVVSRILISLVIYSVAFSIIGSLSLFEVRKKWLSNVTTGLLAVTAALFSYYFFEDWRGHFEQEFIALVLQMLSILCGWGIMMVFTLHKMERPKGKLPVQLLKSRLMFHCPNCSYFCHIEIGKSACPNCGIHYSLDMYF